VESYSYQRADVEKLLKEADVFELSTEARVRLECLLHYATHGRNASVTSRRFGISRTTFYSWLTKADLQDPSSLEDRSKAPKHVPQPETNEQTIALIRAYRKEQTQLSKEKISALLREEHGIEISASTVGRVIHRFGFYFADTPSHQAKRSAGETQTEDENPQKGGWQKAAVMVITTAGASFFADVKPAHALQGSVYQLNPAPPDQTVGGELEGASFILQDAGTTDTAQLLQGSDYQMTAPGTASSSAQSSLSSAIQSSASGTTGGGDTTGGGRRTIPTVQSTSSSSLATQSSAKSVVESPSAPSVPATERTSGSSSAAPPAIPAKSGVAAHRYAQDKLLSAPASPSSAIPGAQTSHSGQIHTDQKSGSLHEAAPRFATIHAQQPTEFAGVVGTTILVTILAGLVGRSWLLQRFTPRAKRSVGAFFVLFAALLLALLWNITSASAKTTVPLTRWYQGHLLNSDGDAVTTAITIRFSEWKSADAEAGDLTATGSINTSAANYVSWQEEHTLTPQSDGSFAVELGSIHALPDFSTLPPSVLQSLYLQVDVKTSGAADSTYDMLDADTGSATIDRTSILSLPFARNADLLDQRDVGTGSGTIPVLSSGSSLSLNGDLTINADADPRDAKLTFGNSILNETLKFSATNSRFEFSHPLWVGGNITATGSLNVLGTMSGAGLQVNGAAVIRDSLELKGNVLLHWNDGKAGINNPPAAGRGSANELSFLTNDGAALTEKMTITSDGKVGIGTTSPTKKLTVVGGDIAVDGNAYFVSNGQQILTNSPTQSNNTLLDSPAGIGFRPGSSGSPLVFFNSSGNVGIGVTAPETKLEVAGTMSGKSLQVTGTGAAPLIYTDQMTGRVGIGTATPGTAGLAVMNGNVGIGTTAPANQLEVRSDSSTPEITIPLRLTNYGSEGANYGVGIAFSPYPGDSRYNITGLISVVNDGGAYNPTSMRFSTLAPNSYPAERMRIGGGTLATEGNLGIGTTTPETKLEVTGTASGNFIFGQNGLATSGALVIAPKPGTGTGNIFIVDTKGLVYDATNKRVGIGTINPASLLQLGDYGVTTDSVLNIVGYGSTRQILRLADGANYGFTIENDGAAVPSLRFVRHANSPSGTDALTISRDTGEVAVTNDLKVGGTAQIGAGASDASATFGYQKKGAIFYVDNYSNDWARGDFYFALNPETSTPSASLADTKMVIKNGGNVGIGTTAPETKLEVVGTMSGKSLQVTGTGAAPLIYTDTTTGRVGIGTATPGTAGLAIMNGNVGIGTTSPREALDVNGNITTDWNDNTRFIGMEYLNGAAYRLGIVANPTDRSTSLVANTIDGTGPDSNNSLKFQLGNPSSPNTAMTINKLGNVGIGTTAPETKLEVTGTMSGKSLHAEQELTSSGALIVESNGRFGGNLEIAKADPEVRLTNTGNGTYTRQTRSGSANQFNLYNQIALTPSGSSNAVPIMTSNTTPSGVASASDYFGGGYEAFRAFDHDNSSEFCWFSNPGALPKWLQYQFTSGKVITRYDIYTRNGDLGGRKPKNWTLSGSNDGTNWTTLDTQTNQFDATGTVDSNSYSVSNSTSYTYYRLNISADWGDSYMGIGELELYDSSSIEEVSIIQHSNSGTDILGTLQFGDAGTYGTYNKYEGRSHVFNVLGNAIMNIAASGNVGIGTTTPNVKLSVAGTASGKILSFGERLTGSGAVSIRTLTDSTTAFQVFKSTGTSPVFNIDTSNERVGIGTAAPQTALEVIGTMSGSNLTLSGKAAANKVLCIKTTGEVGICSSAVDADGGCTCN